MKGRSKLVMGATLVMVVSLAIVLALFLVLLAELYCSLLLRRRRLSSITTTSTTTNTASSPRQSSQQGPSASPLSSFYAQGVLRAPRSLLFPTIIGKGEEKEDNYKQFSELDQVGESRTQEASSTPHFIGLSSAASPSPSFTVASPHPLQEVALEGSSSGGGGRSCGAGEEFVYISNPIYDNDACRENRVVTPFETPDTSPSRLEMGGSFSSSSSSPMTPPLTPMKKLPGDACSVSLRDARSIGTSGSGSDSKNGSSSSSSGSPRTSPSW